MSVRVVFAVIGPPLIHELSSPGLEGEIVFHSLARIAESCDWDSIWRKRRHWRRSPARATALSIGRGAAACGLSSLPSLRCLTTLAGCSVAAATDALSAAA